MSWKGYVCVISVDPCELHCRPVNEHFSERMLDTVVDGTQCYEGSQSRDICVNGICKVGNGFDIFAQSQTVLVNYYLSFSSHAIGSLVSLSINQLWNVITQEPQINICPCTTPGWNSCMVLLNTEEEACFCYSFASTEHFFTIYI